MAAFGFLRRQRAGVLHVIVASLLGIACLDAQQFTSRVVSVSDGDTVDVLRGVSRVRVRIFGIDAPELNQPFGNEAREVASRLILNKSVVITMRDVDTYGRLVAQLSIDGRDVGRELVSAGAAWDFASFSRDREMAAVERQARAARRGLWALPGPVAPWLFRETARSTTPSSVPRPPATGTYHGNAQSFVLHAPGCDSYACANCTVGFDSVDAAVKAGFRPHASCIRR
jgi:endonuclease YncB( thermonuclease family)